MTNYWHDKLALITGGSGGIGENIAEFLSLQGCRIVLVARSLDKLKAVTQRINAEGGKVAFFQSDLSHQEDRMDLYQKVSDEFGIPDILVNNAGIGWYGYFSQMPWSVANELIELNIKSVTHLTSLFLPGMLKLPKARIINIGSIAGKLPEQGIALYSASKAYMDAFTTSLYRELRGTNVTATVLRAGPVKSDFFNRALESPSGGRIPGELFSISPDRVSKKVWQVIQHPHRFVYVPIYLSISPLLETLFAWLIDLIGPVLLKSSSRKVSSNS